MVKASYKGRLKGAEIQKQKRLHIIRNYREPGIRKIGEMDDRDLLVFGLGWYLGEGNKQGNHFQFVNSNPDVIQAIMIWLRLFGINNDDFYCNIIINKIHHGRVADVRKKWKSITGFSDEQFKKTILIKSVGKKVYENNDNYLRLWLRVPIYYIKYLA